MDHFIVYTLWGCVKNTQRVGDMSLLGDRQHFFTHFNFRGVASDIQNSPTLVEFSIISFTPSLKEEHHNIMYIHPS